MQNREIKFRAWDGKRMINNVDLLHTYQGVAVCNELDFENNKAICSLLGDYPVMQYTGLKDKNGKEIYEGDIIEHEGFYGIRRQEVEWSGNVDGDGTVTPGFYIDVLEHYGKPLNCEVIGNIYENPELLENN